MDKSRVKIITTIYFGEIEYSIMYQISEGFDSNRTINCIALCEYAIMQNWSNYFNINGKFNSHWLPSGKSSTVTLYGCPIEVVKETAELIRRIIDAEKVEEAIIDAREKANRTENQTNRQGLQVIGA